MMNAQFIVDQFPILKSQHNGESLVYLDNANTSLTPECVLKEMNAYYRESNANIHRGIYHLSESATVKYQDAREKVAQFINAHPEEVIFTRNATESINLVVNTWGRKNLSEGDVVLLSESEHHSNIVPWQLLQTEKKFSIEYLKIDEEGRINLDELNSYLKNENIKVVSIAQESNALGVVHSVQKIVEMCASKNVVTLIDACQSAPHIPIDVQNLSPDFLVFTGHKAYGPTGIGVLYAKQSQLQNLPPFLGGGDMISSVTKEHSEWAKGPQKFEAGTPNIAGAIGLGRALGFISEIGWDQIQQHEKELTEHALTSLKNHSFIKLHGPLSLENRGPIMSFSVDGVHPHDVASILAEKNICVRAGHHCAQPLMEVLQVPATTRMSFSMTNTKEDIDKAIERLIFAHNLFA